MKLLIKFSVILLLAISSCQSQRTMDTQAKIIFKDSSGHILQEADLVNVTGQVNYEMPDKKSISPEASALHQESRVQGQSGKYDLSISKLQQAMNLEPDWAYPVYDLAYTYLLKGDFPHALEYYWKTNPKGFFTAKTALYALEGEERGIFPKGTYLASMIFTKTVTNQGQHT